MPPLLLKKMPQYSEKSRHSRCREENGLWHLIAQTSADC